MKCPLDMEDGANMLSHGSATAMLCKRVPSAALVWMCALIWLDRTAALSPFPPFPRQVLNITLAAVCAERLVNCTDMRGAFVGVAG